MTKPLADPMAARDHARAMAGTKVDTMPVLRVTPAHQS